MAPAKTDLDDNLERKLRLNIKLFHDHCMAYDRVPSLNEGITMKVTV